MNSPFLQLLARWAVLALGVMLATKIVPGIRCDDGTTLVVVVVLLSFFNVILKPLLVLFTLPFIVLTLGLGVLVINAFLFLLVGEIVGDGFVVASFWSALGGSVIVSVTNLLLNSFTRRPSPPPPPRNAPPPRDPPPPKPKGDDVIDI